MGRAKKNQKMLDFFIIFTFENSGKPRVVLTNIKFLGVFLFFLAKIKTLQMFSLFSLSKNSGKTRLVLTKIKKIGVFGRVPALLYYTYILTYPTENGF